MTRASDALLILALFSLGLPTAAARTIDCTGAVGRTFEDLTSSRPKVDQLFPDLKQRNPELHRLLHSSALKRWRRADDPGWHDVYRQITRCARKGGECVLAAGGKGFWLNGSLSINAGVLQVVVEEFSTRVFDPVKQEWRMLAFKESPEGISPSFSHLLGVLLESTLESVQENQSIHLVRIVGGRVIHPQLIEMLRRLGFKPQANESVFRGLAPAAAVAKMRWNRDLVLTLPVSRP